MTKITPQFKHRDALERLQIRGYVLLACASGRSIIDQQHACTNLGSFEEHTIDPAAQLGCGLPVVSYRHADDKTH
jgi:hypothetical protein